MKIRAPLAAAVCSILALAGCVSTPASPGTGPNPETESGTLRPASTLDEMKRLLETARTAQDSNHPAEAIRSYVTVLALSREDGTAEAVRLGSQAEAELVRIGNRLSLEPGEGWIGPDGSQVAAASRSVGKEGALQPAVFLFENFAAAKSPVGDAPIRFEFVRGGGVLTTSVSTDIYGRANAILSRLDSPSSEAVVRAYPAFTVRGYTYAFRNVQRDFSYLPPSNVAKIVALERGPEGAVQNPQILDSVAAVLKGAGLSPSPLDGKLLGPGFDRAFGGDPASVRALAASAGASYIAFAVSEASPARQMEYGGKKYNIFTSDCKTTIRIIRDDGTIVFALPLDPIRGQGGTAAASVSDSFLKAREALTSELNRRVPEIRKAVEQ